MIARAIGVERRRDARRQRRGVDHDRVGHATGSDPQATELIESIGVGECGNGFVGAIPIHVAGQLHEHIRDPLARIGGVVVVHIEEHDISHHARTGVAEVQRLNHRRGVRQRRTAAVVADSIRILRRRQPDRQGRGLDLNDVGDPGRRRAESAERIRAVRVRCGRQRLDDTISVVVAGERHDDIGDAFARIGDVVPIQVDENRITDRSGAAVAEVASQVARRAIGQRRRSAAIASAVRVAGLSESRRQTGRVDRDRIRHADGGCPQSTEEETAVRVGRGDDVFVHAVAIQIASQCHRDVGDALAGIGHSVLVDVQEHDVANRTGTAVAEVAVQIAGGRVAERRDRAMVPRSIWIERWRDAGGKRRGVHGDRVREAADRGAQTEE